MTVWPKVVNFWPNHVYGMRQPFKGPDQFIPETGFLFNRKKRTLNGPFSASFWSCALRFSEIIGQVLIRSFPGSFGFFRTTTVYK